MRQNGIYAFVSSLFIKQEGGLLPSSFDSATERKEFRMVRVPA